MAILDHAFSDDLKLSARAAKSTVKLHGTASCAYAYSYNDSGLVRGLNDDYIASENFVQLSNRTSVTTGEAFVSSAN